MLDRCGPPALFRAFAPDRKRQMRMFKQLEIAAES